MDPKYIDLTSSGFLEGCDMADYLLNINHDVVEKIAMLQRR